MKPTFLNSTRTARPGRRAWLVLGLLSALLAGLADTESPAPIPAPDPPVSFDRDVRPLLSDRCFPCHGPDAADRKARLRLDRPDGPDGAYRTRRGVAGIRPGSLEDSAVWQRLTTTDEDDLMPPAEAHKPRLSAEERDVVRRWILQGAPYEQHWSFVAPVAPKIPTVQTPGWSRGAIDTFVLHRLEASGLAPAPLADRRTLLRRLSLDLTGLPPTRGEIARFIADERPGAYERTVDRLLASPRFGEHLSRYWLDLVRFADTNGVHHDHFRDLSSYRDWVIRSFNRNLPFDQFIIDQVAGDLHVRPTDDQLIASGFHRLHRIIDVGTALPEESFTNNVVDRVTAFGTAFLGLTVHCSVCHDHKYDPIPQQDFYGLFAFFNNIDAAPETGRRSGADFRRGLQRPYIEFPTEQQIERLAAVDGRLAKARAEVTRLNAPVAKATGDEKKALTKKQQQARGRVRKIGRERTAILIEVPAAMVMKERAKERPAHVLIRGAYDKPGKQVARATPSFLPPLPATKGSPTRMDLARWLVAPGHPLTARVTVNRFWQQLFGVGLVKTAEDFGAQGERPSHPDLLDHLAVSFLRSGWDVKALFKQIVMSETYRQSSAVGPAAFRRDPENRRLARGSRFRLDAEVIRDQILATSGLLNPTMYGKSVKPPQPAGIWKAVALPDSYPRIFRADDGDAIFRRSVYTFWKRGLPPPQMTILDAPTREFCAARRERTNTPSQALLLMNEPEFLRAARHLAATTLGESESAERRVDRIYETITSRRPDATERELLLRFVRDVEARYRKDAKLAEELCAGTELGEGTSRAELSAWTLLTSAIYNLDITKTRE